MFNFTILLFLVELAVLDPHKVIIPMHGAIPAVNTAAVSVQK